MISMVKSIRNLSWYQCSRANTHVWIVHEIKFIWVSRS